MQTQNFFGAWLHEAQQRVDQLATDLTAASDPVVRAATSAALREAEAELSMLNEMVNSVL